MTGKVVKI